MILFIMAFMQTQTFQYFTKYEELMENDLPNNQLL
jgi:hypothetical protein